VASKSSSFVLAGGLGRSRPFIEIAVEISLNASVDEPQLMRNLRAPCLLGYAVSRPCVTNSLRFSVPTKNPRAEGKRNVTPVAQRRSRVQDAYEIVLVAVQRVRRSDETPPPVIFQRQCGRRGCGLLLRRRSSWGPGASRSERRRYL
jgi:hypothetical protein